MADVVGCLTTKGIAIGERYAEKDAYDIFSVVAHYRRGPEDAAAAVMRALGNGLVDEAISNIAEKFETIRSAGPVWVADFLGAAGGERERMVADAYVQVSSFLENIGAKRREPR